MTVSAVSAGITQPNPYAQDRQTFGQLVSALNSGDLSAAQSAYNALSASPLAQGNGPFGQALQQIGQSLQSGDLSGAQSALASLQQARGGHHHHHHGGAKPADNDANQPASGDASQTNTVVSTDTTISVNITA